MTVVRLLDSKRAQKIVNQHSLPKETGLESWVGGGGVGTGIYPVHLPIPHLSLWTHIIVAYLLQMSE